MEVQKKLVFVYISLALWYNIGKSYHNQSEGVDNMKRRGLMLIALVLISVILVGCTGGESTSRVVKQFVNYVETGNGDKLNEMTVDYEGDWNDILHFMGNVKDSSIVEVKSVGDYIEATVYFITDGITYPGEDKIEDDFLFELYLTFYKNKLTNFRWLWGIVGSW